MNIVQQSEVTNQANHLAPECPFSSAIISFVKELGLLVFIKSLTMDKTMNSIDAMARNRSIPNSIVIIFYIPYFKIFFFAVFPVQGTTV